MIRTILIGLFAAACFAQTAPELGLFVRYDSKPATVFVGAMRAELGSILAPADFDIQWLLEDQPHGSKTWLRAVFIHFRGVCSGATRMAPASRAGYITLAETPVSDGAILPYTETDCDGLRAFLADGNSGNSDEQLGIAMARVIAHELYHVLLQTTEHSKTGIARAAHTPDALLGQSLRFEDGELDRIRHRYSIMPSAATIAQKMSFSANWSVRGPKP